MTHIAVITGTRAEFGLLRPLILALKHHKRFRLSVYVTGMHLSQYFGDTWREIEEAGIEIDERIEVLLASDTRVSINKSIALGISSFAEVFNRNKPDAVMVLGDRTEILAATISAYIHGIYIIHIHGGEATFGAYDEGIRHSITKMSNLHFTSTEEYRKRVIQLGESPDTVYNVGAIGLDSVRTLPLKPKGEMEKELGISLDGPTLLLTYHPTTVGDDSGDEFQEVLNGIERTRQMNVVITLPNSDSGNIKIRNLISSFQRTSKHNVVVFTSLGQLRYFSLLPFVSVVIGNSSSGILEVPYFKKPTVNIGDRQKGRLQTKSVFNCHPDSSEVYDSIDKALKYDFEEFDNPYDQGGAVPKIMEVLTSITLVPGKKEFYDIDFDIE
jgi:GDP/UDP-N,N'-diacetylbacillosamine 2-epimerase (hydrolysing)